MQDVQLLQAVGVDNHNKRRPTEDLSQLTRVWVLNFGFLILGIAFLCGNYNHQALQVS